MDVGVALIELREHAGDDVAAWAATMNARRDEALATLRDEGVLVESWFAITLGGKDYLVAYMRAHSLDEAQEAAARSPHEIDAVHRDFKRAAWAGVTKGTLLLDLVRTAEATD